MGNDDRIEAEAMTASLAGLVPDDAQSDSGAASCKIAFVLILLVSIQWWPHSSSHSICIVNLYFSVHQ